MPGKLVPVAATAITFIPTSAPSTTTMKQNKSSNWKNNKKKVEVGQHHQQQQNDKSNNRRRQQRQNKNNNHLATIAQGKERVIRSKSASHPSRADSSLNWRSRSVSPPSSPMHRVRSCSTPTSSPSKYSHLNLRSRNQMLNRRFTESNVALQKSRSNDQLPTKQHFITITQHGSPILTNKNNNSSNNNSIKTTNAWVNAWTLSAEVVPAVDAERSPIPVPKGTKPYAEGGPPGDLFSRAVEVFSRAYGLNGFEPEDHAQLMSVVKEEVGCSDRAVMELLYGFSYSDILDDLRAQVRMYPRKPKVIGNKSRNKEKRVHELKTLALLLDPRKREAGMSA